MRDDAVQSSGQQLFPAAQSWAWPASARNPRFANSIKKKKYNEWQFVYDPTTEPRNGLITTPNQPLLQAAFGSQGGNLNGQPGTPTGQRK